MNKSVSDFQIENMTFEVGGRNKKQKQLHGIDNGFIVKDDIETGFLMSLLFGNSDWNINSKNALG